MSCETLSLLFVPPLGGGMEIFMTHLLLYDHGYKKQRERIAKEKVNKEDKYSNRMSLPKDGVLLAENDAILLRAVSEDQKDDMLRVSYECSFLKHEFENETYRNYLWEAFIGENAANYCIYAKDTKDFVGYCGIKDLTREMPELAIELLSKYRKHYNGPIN